jgi:hypothetical protein
MDFTTICPPAYSHVDMPNSSFPCLPSCPAEFYPEWNYHLTFIIHVVSSFTAIIAAVSVMIPYLFIPNKLRWPNTLHFCIFISVMMLSVTGVIGLFISRGDYKNLICKDSVTVATTSHVPCGLTGSMYYLSTFIGVFLWMFIAISPLMILSQGTTGMLKILTPNVTVQKIIAFSFSYGVPIIMMIVVIVTDSVEGSIYNAGCFINGSKNDGWYIDAYWVIPSSCILTIGTISIVFTLVYAFRHVEKDSREDFFKKHWRLFAFLAVYMYPSLLGTFYRLYTWTIQDEIKNGAIGWYTCLPTTFYPTLINYMNTTFTGDMSTFNSTLNAAIAYSNKFARDECQHHLEPMVYYGISLWITFNDFVTTILCMIFIIQEDVLFWWKKTISNIFGMTFKDSGSRIHFSGSSNISSFNNSDRVTEDL